MADKTFGQAAAEALLKSPDFQKSLDSYKKLALYVAEFHRGLIEGGLDPETALAISLELSNRLFDVIENSAKERTEIRTALKKNLAQE
jgi:hypothetical protein